MIKRRSLTTGDMKILVLDEADEMLNKGFREQIYDVYRFLPPDIQVIIVSATLPHDVLEMTHKFMQDPVRVLVKRDELTLEVRLTEPFSFEYTAAAAVAPAAKTRICMCAHVVVHALCLTSNAFCVKHQMMIPVMIASRVQPK